MALLEKVKKNFKKILVNKYLLALVVFGIFITFFDNNSLLSRWYTGHKISNMEKEKKFYEEEIASNKQKLNELQSSDENLEKFAREHYLMKRKNEDIFIIKE